MAKPNEGKQVGEPCEMCGRPLVEGKFGAYCKPCFIEYKNKKEGMPASEGGYAPKASPASSQRFTGASYAPQPKKDFKATMDYKEQQISKMQDSKEESMRLFSAGRDATLVVTAIMDKGWDDKLIEDTLLKWRKFFYQRVYTMKEEEYQIMNAPF